MKNLVLTALMILVGITTMAQTTIKGIVVDSLSMQGEPFATVSLSSKAAPQVPVGASVTDLDGSFTITAKQNGDFIVKISSVGKTTVERVVSCKGGSVNLGTLSIAEDSKQIEGISVVAQKPLVKVTADELQYSVEDDPESSVTTVLDMLRKVPLVSVDGQDNITVNGSGAFQVYVDGKPNQMMSANASTIFKAMPASAIKSITVVTNPGAKYDAEGAGGVLSITMAGGPETAHATDGYLVSFNATAGNRNNLLGGYAMVQHGKATLDVNAFGGEFLMRDLEMEMNRTGSDGSYFNYSGWQKNHTTQGSISLGANIDFDKNNALQIEGATNKMASHGRSHMTNTNGFGDFETSYLQIGENRQKSSTVNGSIDYTHLFGERKSLTVGYRISNRPSESEEKSSFENSSMASNENHNENSMLEQIAQADLSLRLGSYNTLEVGAKYTNRKNESISPTFSYNHDNNIFAGYASYGLSYDKYSLKAGLRYEHTAQDIEYNLLNDVSTTYDNLIPSASLGIRIGMTQNIGLSYNLRLNRPGITYLNPYDDGMIENFATIGNPDLDVEKTNNLQLTYGSFGQKIMLNASLRYSFVNNGIQEYSYLDGNRQITTYGNVAKSKMGSLNIYFRWTITPKTSIMLSSTTSYADLRSEVINAHNSGWSERAMVQFSQEFPKNFRFSAFYMGNTSAPTLQGNSTGMTMHSMTLSKSFNNNKVTLGLQAMNPFKSNIEINSKTIAEDFTTESNISIGMRSIALQCNIQLGNTNKRRQSRQHDDDGVMERQSEVSSTTSQAQTM